MAILETFGEVLAVKKVKLTIGHCFTPSYVLYKLEPSNVAEIQKITGCNELHGRRIVGELI